ncbi:MAG TPA: bifunctional transaldolase/phosoglucose isomerase [Anaerolineales bacterium]|nr:bifunctional transaldolase/phosoglucose isomerase [Anaerolineales bacterium]
MSNNPLLDIQKLGQSIWLDYIRRGMLNSRELERLIQEDGLRGVTVNPSILEKAIGGSHDYDEAIQELAREDMQAAGIYEALAIEDVQRAADLFRPLYESSEGEHGYVSLEVSPYLAHDSQGTIQEARRFWKELDRPNVMIKVPATPEGLPAIRQLIAEGINVNVTLLFGLPRYREVAEAYISGLEDRRENGGSIDRVASVASFFLSRIDVLVDPMLDKLMRAGNSVAETAKDLHGQVAVASAKIAYSIYKQIFQDQRFRKLADQGARSQRLLWASTSTKNPDYSDVKYVEALIGPDTVNTLPLETLNAYRHHGNPASRLEEGAQGARQMLDCLPDVHIDIDAVTFQLLEEGVEKFTNSYDRLLDTLRQKRELALSGPPDRQWVYLGEYETGVKQRLDQLEEGHFSSRLWRKDASLWKKDPGDQKVIANALGWLHVAEKMEENLAELRDFAAEVRSAGLAQVVHLGMGGSSLAPLVLQRTFEPGPGGLPLTVLDTTDPSSILDIERANPLADTLFIVASKSGTTAETRALADYFYHWTSTHTIPPVGDNFVAITDPGTPLADLAGDLEFRRLFLNYTDIGGRYSALSCFGLVPAALMGLDLDGLLNRALRMVHACASSVPAQENPGMMLGAALGELALNGRDKITFLVPESMATFGMWLEQLIAESTGKEGKGIVPVAGEPVGAPLVYGNDRFFVYFRIKDQIDRALDKLVEDLEAAGHPVFTIRLDEPLDLVQEFFRWEIATATAGSILGINAFNQPNVQESKDNTNRLLAEVQEEGYLEEQEPDLVEDHVGVYAQEVAASLAGNLAQFFSLAKPGDYVALMAYLAEEPATNRALQHIRVTLRNSLHLATTLGYGPRFLHSTGQLHKGGPNTGLFIQITADDTDRPRVRNAPYTFDVFKRAQALGDLDALKRHGRRVIRIHLGVNVERGLEKLKEAVEASFSVDYRV